MRIIYFATYYDKYLEGLYENKPELGKMQYKEQLQVIMDDCFGAFGTYTYYANVLGMEAHLIIANAKPLQQKWAEENNVVFPEKDWLYTIPLEQIKNVKPDVFFIGSMFNYYGGFLNEVKKYTKNIFGWIACEIPKKTDPSQLSLILSSVPYYVDMFRGDDFQSELLPAAFDTRILDNLEFNRDKTALSFVGGLGPAHKKRKETVRYVASKAPLEFWGYGKESLDENLGRIQRFFGIGSLAKRHHGEIWGIDMFQILAQSQITLNVHIDVAREYGINMRMYEATGVGTLLLTDGASNQMFKDGQEVVYYTSPQDAVEKAIFYLKNPKEREAIAKRGQERTLKEYNSECNMKLMLDLFTKNMR